MLKLTKELPVVGSLVGYLEQYNKKTSSFDLMDIGVVKEIYEHNDKTYYKVEFREDTDGYLLNQLALIV